MFGLEQHELEELAGIEEFGVGFREGAEDAAEFVLEKGGGGTEEGLDDTLEELHFDREEKVSSLFNACL